jgi:hypothetical protein
MLDLLVSESNRPVTWLVLLECNDIAGGCPAEPAQIRAPDRARRYSADKRLPLFNEISLESPFIFGRFRPSDC